MKRKRQHFTVNVNRDILATIAMHGIHTAMSSPQFYDRLELTARATKMPLHDYIAHMSYGMAEAMMKANRQR